MAGSGASGFGMGKRHMPMPGAGNFGLPCYQQNPAAKN
jgi:hypothetical protein